MVKIDAEVAMGLHANLILAAVFGVTLLYLSIKVNKIFEIPPVPDLGDVWWGPGEPQEQSKAIIPFKINISDEVLNDLKRRLNNARPFTKPLEGIQHQYGMNTDLLKEIVEFWKTKYDWREREKFLNQYPQFTTNIQGLKIHFLRVKPTSGKNLRVLPMLILHGWPGSVRLYFELIPFMTTPQRGRDFVFEVIVASLPGYGFSEGASKPGLGSAQMSVVLKNLMVRLGFEKFYVQGGDWGSLIVSNMAVLFPEKILGVHVNPCLTTSPYAILKMFIGSLYPPLVIDRKYEYRIYPLTDLFSYWLSESGYVHLQATKPDTIGVSLNDSPVGLAAYILEKYISWTNHDWLSRKDGGLAEKFSYARLLDNVMIYWVTNSITTSVRLYSENFNKSYASLSMESLPIKVPAACANFRHELIYQPESFLKHRFTNITQFTHIENGGHFAGFEVPESLAEDIWSAVEKFEEIYKN